MLSNIIKVELTFIQGTSRRLILLALWARYLERCHLCDATRNPFEVRSGQTQMLRNLFRFVYSVTERIILLLHITPCFIQNRKKKEL